MTSFIKRLFLSIILLLGFFYNGEWTRLYCSETISDLVQDDDVNEGTDGIQETHSLEPPVYDFLSLCDKDDMWKRLDKKAPLWVSTDRTKVTIGGEICLREGLLEFFACRRNSKEHESIIVLDVPPHLICAALLAIGAKQGAPAKYEPNFIPPSGEEIEIEVRWREEGCTEPQKALAQEFVVESESDEIMKAPWVFTGGLFAKDPEGKKYYLANVTGEVIGVSNFPGSILDVPLESSSDNSELCYAPNTKRIPKIGTNVLLILSKKEH